MDNEDLKRVKSGWRLVDLAFHFGIPVHKEGSADEGKIICPRHQENTPSCHLYRDRWHCFGCGAHGDAIELCQIKTGKTFPDALKYLAEHRSIQITDTDFKPPTTSAYKSQDGRKKGTFAGKWLYVNAENKPVGQIFKFIKEDGGKDFGQRHWGHDDKLRKWTWLPKWPGTNKPLWNLPKVLSAPNIIVVSGEKCAMILELNLRRDDIAVTTWTCGDTGWKKHDLTSLSGKKVIFWADNETKSLDAFLAAAKSVEKDAKSIKILPIVAGKDSGWDVADLIEEEPQTSVLAYISKRQASLEQMEELYASSKPRKRQRRMMDGDDPEEDSPAVQTAISNLSDNRFFKIVGKKQKTVYIWLHDSGEMVDFNYSNLYDHRTMEYILPRHNDWVDLVGESALQLTSKQSQQTIGRMLLEVARTRPISDAPNNLIRGRGVWSEGESILINNGSILYKDMTPVQPEQTYFYSKGDKSGFDPHTPPLHDEGMQTIVRLIRSIHSLDPVDQIAVLGWPVIALLGAAIPERAHMLITGPTQVGKSTIGDGIIGGLLGTAAATSQGLSSESGIRRQIDNQSRPRILDEGDVSNMISGREKMLGINTLMRIATRGGFVDLAYERFYIMCPFLVMCVTAPDMGEADLNRVYQLEITDVRSPESRNINYNETVHPLLEQTVGALPAARTKEQIKFSAQWRSKILRNAADIVANVRIMRAAMARSGLTIRECGVLGAILAGYYIYKSEGIISETAAQELVSEYLAVRGTGSRVTGDEMACWHIIMDHVRIWEFLVITKNQIDHLSYSTQRREMPVSEVCRIAVQPEDDTINPTVNMAPSEARTALHQFGIGIDLAANKITIFNSSTLRFALRGSKYEQVYRKVLARLPGAEDNSGQKSKRHVQDDGTTTSTRSYVTIPLYYITDHISHDIVPRQAPRKVATPYAPPSLDTDEVPF